MAKVIDDNIEINPEVAELMEKFKPVFGDKESLYIGELWERYRNLLTLEKRAKDRRKEAEKAVRAERQAQKKIASVESSLIAILKRRTAKK